MTVHCAGSEETETQPNDEYHLLEIQRLSRAQLVAPDGTTYSAFRRTLTPRYAVLWMHVGLHYVTLAAAAASIGYFESALWWPWRLATAVAGGVAFGYLFSSLTNFFHEATHYNLCQSRQLNDRLAGIFICPIVGVDLKSYRPIHFAHHRHLGTTMDEEVSYFDPLDLRTLVEVVLPVKVARMLAEQRVSRGSAPSQGARRVPTAALALHVSILIACAASGRWALALAWAGGMVSFFPLFQTLRQILEHRGYDAQSDVDYRVVPQGATARMFGDGVVASTLGSAGFNRHMLHHWEPQISYTRLRDLERFLASTTAAPALDRGRATYFGAFARLFRPRFETRR